ncbi:hypothetical protein KXD93_16350 [Mucilaginibacter sp. BJC16-A38]|uniref:hypothetical protein n=1 Tax=Mucilaginibacter phenanthrenivorans TaxID=1234842 RepID=UPI0021576079|nr:hypothetical protein [Mucilaginibacter phenanthrenivorans]MCR8559230.1 hypothetical protein [Mucilaginibacter phenanthrenivorans]
MNNIDSIFFHEDDYCQIELLPLVNLLANLNEVDNPIYLAQENHTSFGFSGLYNKDATVISLSVLNIFLDDFEKILRKNALFCFKKVYTGYSSERILKDNIGAFGFENYVIYYKHENGIILTIWLGFSPLLDTLKVYPQKLINSLNELGLAYNLILTDWIENITVNLKSTHIISNYFKEVLL